MRNVCKKVVMSACALALAVCLVACGKTPSASGSPSASAGSASPKASSNASGKFESLDAFVKSDLMQQQLKAQQDSLKDSGMSVDIVADGDKLIYNFTIEDADVAAVMDADTLEAGLKSQASTFEGIAKSLKAAVEVENPAVEVRYLDPDGKEIYAQAFSA
nr:DUF4854 domain-containing protein [Maliibacterium massiliense]